LDKRTTEFAAPPPACTPFKVLLAAFELAILNEVVPLAAAAEKPFEEFPLASLCDTETRL
jgi:hypothetical protein